MYVGVGLDKCGEMIANELGDTPSTCSTISHHVSTKISNTAV